MEKMGIGMLQNLFCLICFVSVKGSMLGYWPLDDDTYTKLDINGDVIGTVSPTQPYVSWDGPVAHFKTSVLFGPDDAASVLLENTASPLTDINQCPNGISLSFYYKMSATPAGVDQIVVSTGGHLEYSVGYVFRYVGSYNAFQTLVQNADHYWYNEFDVDRTKWMHLEIYWDPASTLTVYANDQLIQATARQSHNDVSGTAWTPRNKLYLGGWGTDMGARLTLDELMIWDEIIPRTHQALKCRVGWTYASSISTCLQIRPPPSGSFTHNNVKAVCSNLAGSLIWVGSTSTDEDDVRTALGISQDFFANGAVVENGTRCWVCCTAGEAIEEICAAYSSLSVVCKAAVWSAADVGITGFNIVPSENLPSVWTVSPSDLVTEEDLIIATDCPNFKSRFMISFHFGDPEGGEYTQTQICRGIYRYQTPGIFTTFANFSSPSGVQETQLEINSPLLVGYPSDFRLVAYNQKVQQPALIQIFAIFRGNFSCVLEFGDGDSVEFDMTESVEEYDHTHTYDIGTFEVHLRCMASAKIQERSTTIYISPNEFEVTIQDEYIFIESSIGFDLSGSITYTDNVNIYMYDENGNQLGTSQNSFDGNSWTFIVPNGVVPAELETQVYFMFTDTVFDTGGWVTLYQDVRISGTSFVTSVIREPRVYEFTFTATAGTSVAAVIDFGHGVPTDEGMSCSRRECYNETEQFSLTCEHLYGVVWPSNSYTATIVAQNRLGSFETSTSITITMPPTTINPALLSISELRMSFIRNPGPNFEFLIFTIEIPQDFPSPVNTSCNITDESDTVIDHMELAMINGSMMRSIPYTGGLLRWPTLVQYSVFCFNDETLNSVSNTTVLYDVVSSLSIQATPSVAAQWQNVTFEINILQGSGVTYDMNFGDGTVTDDIQPQGLGYNASVQHAYSTLGNHTVSMRAWNSWSSVDGNVTVLVYIPVSGLTVTVTPELAPLGEEVIIAFEVLTGSNVFYHVDYGTGADGSDFGPQTIASPISIAHNYSQMSYYNISVAAWNEGGSVTEYAQVTIYSRVASLSLTLTTTPAIVGLPVLFNAVIIEGYNVHFEFYFGDGLTNVSETTCDGPCNITVQHTYAMGGDISVTARAWNDWSHLNETIPIMLESPLDNLQVIGVPPVALVGESLHIEASIDTSMDCMFDFVFGDGESSVDNPATSPNYSAIATYTYASAGDYEVFVTVHNQLFSLNSSEMITIWHPESSLGFTLVTPGPLLLWGNLEFNLTLDYGARQNMTVDFGDGGKFVQLDTDNRVFRINHTYGSPGPVIAQAWANSSNVGIYRYIRLLILDTNRPSISIFTLHVEPLHFIQYDSRKAVVNFTIETDGWFSIDAITDYQIDIDFADSVLLSQPLDSYFYLYEYRLAGSYLISMSITDMLSSERITLNKTIVVAYDCLAPVIYDLPQYSDAATPLQQLVSTPFALTFQMLLQCDGSDHVYTWHFTGVTIDYERYETTTSGTILTDAGTMPEGSYLVSLSVAVSASTPEQVSSTHLYLDITRPPVVAMLTGGDRALGTEQMAALDASASHDPLDAESDLTYIWRCMSVDNNVAATVLVDIPSDSVCTNLLTSDSSITDVLYVDASQLEAGVTYLFQVTITSDDGRYDSAQQLFMIVEGTVPTLEISFASAYLGKWVPESSYSMLGHCLDCTAEHDSYTWDWTIQRLAEDGWEHVDVLQLGFTLSDNMLLCPSNILPPGETYRISVLYGAPDVATGVSFREVLTNLPPYNGSCYTEPTSGDTLTPFSVSCTDWKDEGTAPSRPGSNDMEDLTFMVETAGGLIGIATTMMSMPLRNLYLPEGDSHNDYLLPVRVYIMDSIGSSVTVDLQVQVSPMVYNFDPASSANQSESAALLYDLVSGVTGGNMEDLNSAELAGVVSFLMSMNDILNAMDPNAVNDASLAYGALEGDELEALMGTTITNDPAMTTNRSVVAEAIPDASALFDAIDNVISSVFSTGDSSAVLGDLGLFGAALTADPAPGTPLFDVMQQIKLDSLEAADYFVTALQSPYESTAIESVQITASLLGSATSEASYLTEESAALAANISVALADVFLEAASGTPFDTVVAITQDLMSSMGTVLSVMTVDSTLVAPASDSVVANAPLSADEQAAEYDAWAESPFSPAEMGYASVVLTEQAQNEAQGYMELQQEQIATVISQTESVVRVLSLQMLPGQDVLELPGDQVQAYALSTDWSQLPGTHIATGQANITIGESVSGSQIGVDTRIGITVLNMPSNPYNFGNGSADVTGGTTHIAFWDSDGIRLNLDNSIRIEFISTVMPVPLWIEPVESAGDSSGQFYFRSYTSVLDNSLTIEFDVSESTVPVDGELIYVVAISDDGLPSPDFHDVRKTLHVRPGSPIQVQIPAAERPLSSELFIGIAPLLAVLGTGARKRRSVNMDANSDIDVGVVNLTNYDLLSAVEIYDILITYAIPMDSVSESSVQYVQSLEVDPVLLNDRSYSVEELYTLYWRSRSTFWFSTASTGCRQWLEDSQTWTAQGCQAVVGTTMSSISCVCEGQGSEAFAPSFFPAYNEVDFMVVFTNWDPNNVVVVITCVMFLVGAIPMGIWLYRKDRWDLQQWRVGRLIDNQPGAQCYYLVSVYTGLRPNAGTSSKVGFVVVGEDQDTGIRYMADVNEKKGFDRGGIRRFLMTTHGNLGNLTYIRIWHDGSGIGGRHSWLLDKIVVQDLQTHIGYIFRCGRWMSIDKDDGELERVLPASDEDDVQDVRSIFLDNLTKALTEHHKLLSVLSRPNPSNFTRLQRWGCFVSVTLPGMLITVLFYGMEGTESRPLGIQIGSLKLTTQQLWISLATLVLLLPVSLLLSSIFRKARPKQNNSSQSNSHTCGAICSARPGTSSSMSSRNLITPSMSENEAIDWRLPALPSGSRRPLPHLCVYVGWGLIALIILGSASFCIMLSQTWSDEKSREWLTNVLITILLDIIVVDPIVVLVISATMGVLLKRPAIDIHEADVFTEETYSEWIEPFQREKLDSKEELVPPAPLDQQKRAPIRERRRLEADLSWIVWQVLRYASFVAIIGTIAYANRDRRIHGLTRLLQETILEDVPGTPYKEGFRHVKNNTMLMEWFDSTFLPSFFAYDEYNGDRLHWTQRRFLEDQVNYRVGPARLRQLRVPKVADKDLGIYHVINGGAYSFANSDTNDYCLRWKQPPCNYSSYTFSSDAWRFVSVHEITGVPIWANLHMYEGNGYVANLDINRDISYLILDELWENLWLDEYTRAVLIEFTLYNANVNVFSLLTLVMEYSETGGLVPYVRQQTFRVYMHQGTTGFVVMVMEALFCVVLLYYILSQVRGVRQYGLLFYKNGWNIKDAIMIVVSFIVIGMYIMRFILTDHILGTFRQDPTLFVNFQIVGLWDEYFSCVLGLLVFIFTIDLMRILSFNQNISLFLTVLKSGRQDFTSYSIVFFIILGAFAELGYFIFGQTSEYYLSFMQSLQELLSVMLGKVHLKQAKDSNSDGTVWYMSIYIIASVTVLTNTLVCIIIDALDKASQIVQAQANQYDMVEFANHRLRQMLGLDTQFNFDINAQPKKVEHFKGKVAGPCPSIQQCHDLSNHVDALLTLLWHETMAEIRLQDDELMATILMELILQNETFKSNNVSQKHSRSSDDMNQ